MQRKAWADFLKGANIPYQFFSASLAKEENEAQDSADESEGEDPGSAEVHDDEGQEEEDMDVDDLGKGGNGGAEQAPGVQAQGEAANDADDDTRILTVGELERILLRYAPKDAGGYYTPSDSELETNGVLDPKTKLQVGLVGYPNVGKSSTINALIGSKKVSVSATPGKTKHFQTIHLSDKVILCDCPGLVFPNFASTKAELVCNGILPIDQLREFTGPAALVAKRIPQPFLEAVYGIQIRKRPLEEGGTGVPTAEELLVAYARARGFTKTGVGAPDESRAARYILKDYVNGKLLYCEPPPGSMDPEEFNNELYDMTHLPVKRRLALIAAMEASSAAADDGASMISEGRIPVTGAKSKKLDKAFFRAGGGSAGHATMPFNYKYSEQGKQLSGRKARAMVALETGVDPKDVKLNTGKKHFKGGQSKSKKRLNRVDEDTDL
jgi:large subunit GTPase 1